MTPHQPDVRRTHSEPRIVGWWDIFLRGLNDTVRGIQCLSNDTVDVVDGIDTFACGVPHRQGSERPPRSIERKDGYCETEL